MNTNQKNDKQSVQLILLVSSFFLLVSCTGDPELPDLNTIEWITRYGYTNQEIFPLVTSAKIPGPRVKLSVGSESRYLLIDPNSTELLIRENAFRNADFEPQRLASHLIGTNELMVEEGYLHNVSFFNFEFPIAYACMIKQSSTPFPVSGIIGRDLLGDGRLTIDMRNQILAFTQQPAVALENLAADSHLVAFTLNRGASDTGGLLKLPCFVNGNRCLATLDTQHAQTQIGTGLARAISSKTPKNSIAISLRIGALEINDLKCDINDDLMTLEPENAAVIDVIIGMDVISQSLVTIDFGDRLILFQ